MGNQRDLFDRALAIMHLKNNSNKALLDTYLQTEADLEDAVDFMHLQGTDSGTDENDYKIKLRNLIRFLGDGDKTKVTLRFRGREIAHQELGMALLKRVEADLEEHGVVEQFPKMEGRQMVMVLSPNKKPKKKVKPAAQKEIQEEKKEEVE